MSRHILLLIVLACAPLVCLADAPTDSCPYGASFKKTTTISREISDFQVTISNDGEVGRECKFVVRDAGGRVLVDGADSQADALPEMYVLRIGTNDLVVETYSGGAHCCWTYYVITQLPAPHLAAKIQNQQPIEFIDYRGIELNDLVARDGEFSYFPGAFSDSAMPMVYLRFVRGQLRDVGALFKAQYDQEIAAARALLSEQTLRLFRDCAGNTLPPECVASASNDSAVQHNILMIVLSYLYSGREEQAWKELAAMWPPGDVERIKQEILKAREKGILRYTRE